VSHRQLVRINELCRLKAAFRPGAVSICTPARTHLIESREAEEKLLHLHIDPDQMQFTFLRQESRPWLPWPRGTSRHAWPEP